MKTTNRINRIYDMFYNESNVVQEQLFLMFKWTFFFMNPIIWCFKNAINFFFHVEVEVL